MKALKILPAVFTTFALPSLGWAKEEPSKAEKAKVIEAYGKIPLHFIQNDGQVDSKVKYYEKGANGSTFFTREGVHLVLTHREKAKDSAHKLSKAKQQDTKLNEQAAKTSSEVIRLIPINAKKDVEVIAEDVLSGKVNYFIGNDPKRWKTDIPTYSKVRYKGIYRGIDLVFYGNQRQLAYDLVVSKDADYRAIGFRIEGAKEVKKTESGDLEIVLPSGSRIVQKSPVIYQEIDGRRVNVGGSFEVKKVKEGYIYAFHVGDYDKDHPLIIDPVVLSYSTYLGGSSDDYGSGIAVDASGNAYVTGYTHSTNFPTQNAYDSTCGTDGNCNEDVSGRHADVFVTKLDPSQSGDASLIYSTYLGGSAWDEGSGIAVDSSGNAYVTGLTGSTDFPTLNAYQGTYGGSYDAFVTKLAPSGNSLIYSTYLGGSDYYGYDEGKSIAVDSSGSAYVTGYTGSSNFPTQNAYQGSNAGGWDVFITKLSEIPTTSYTLSVTKAGTGSGTVTSSPSGINCGSDCSEAYFSGTTVTLTATPNAGSTFTGWSGDCDINGQVTMDADKTCTATFTLNQYTLTVTKTGSGSGTVTSNPAGINCGTDCSEAYAPGITVTLTATPSSGSTFAGWSGDAECTDGVVTMDADKTCIATFTKKGKSGGSQSSHLFDEATREVFLQIKTLAGQGQAFTKIVQAQFALQMFHRLPIGTGLLEPTAITGGRATMQLTSTKDPNVVSVNILSLTLEGKHFSFRPAIQAITGTLNLGTGTFYLTLLFQRLMTPETPQPFTWEGTAEGVYDFASGVVSLTEVGQGAFLVE